MEGLGAWFNAKAEKIQQENTMQRTLYNSQIIYAQYAWLVFVALNNVTGVIAPVDISEVVTSLSVPRNLIFRVTISKGTDANPHVIVSIKNAIFNELSKHYNASIADVKKAHKIDINADNILIKY